MKHLKRIAALLFCLCLFASLTVTAHADTSYTLTAVGGSHAKSYSYSNNGLTIDIPVEMAKINNGLIDNDTLYACKGFHVAGDPTLLVSAQTFDHDVTLIAAYMLKDSAVQYTVRYVNTAGAELYPSMSGYASEGDVIRVAYQYIEGYQPQAYNLQMTMSRSGTNELVFVYTAVPAQGAAGAAAAAPAPGNAAAAAGGAGANAGAGDAGLENLGDGDTPLAAPEDLINLDDEETPQSLPNLTGAIARSEAILRNGRIAAIAGAVGLVAAAFAVFFMFSKKKDQRG